jgi:hypothetical protein
MASQLTRPDGHLAIKARADTHHHCRPPSYTRGYAALSILRSFARVRSGNPSPNHDLFRRFPVELDARPVTLCLIARTKISRGDVVISGSNHNVERIAGFDRAS